MKKLYTLALLLVVGFTAIAQEKEEITPVKNTRLFMEVSLAFGGESLATIEFDDGSDQDLSSGNGGTFTVGVDQRIPNTNFGLRAGIGYKYSGSMADNANIKKTVLPLDILPYYQYKQHKIGAGINYHIKPTLDLDVLGPKIELDNALGYSLEYSYLFDPFQLSASYTVINYGIDTDKINASHVSLKAAYLF